MRRAVAIAADRAVVVVMVVCVCVCVCEREREREREREGWREGGDRVHAPLSIFPRTALE
jgi:hypothetical protein